MVRHATFIFHRGLCKLNWLLRVGGTRHTTASRPSPNPSASTSPPTPATSSSPPTRSASSSPSTAPSCHPSTSPTSAEATPNASLPVALQHTTIKRKAEESLLPESDSDGRRKKIRGQTSLSLSSSATVWKAATLEEIRMLPPSATRPFYPRTLKHGTRSLKEPTPWKCSACGHVNTLTHHLVFNLPAFKCKACNASPCEGDADFGFCYADLAVNEACPIGHVKTQKPGECIPNTVSSCVEITHRIMATILELPLSKEGPFIDISDLLGKYEKRWLEEGFEKSDSYTGRSLWTMLEVFKLDGVKEERTHALQEELHKISDWGWLDQNDFVAMSSALADGYPLICLFKTGPRLGHLKPGEIYVPPSHGAIGGHASLLVGAQQERGVKFFYFLSPTSERFCKRSDKKGDGIRGGFGAIAAGHFDHNVFQILRFNERKNQVVQQQ